MDQRRLWGRKPSALDYKSHLQYPAAHVVPRGGVEFGGVGGTPNLLRNRALGEILSGYSVRSAADAL